MLIRVNEATGRLTLDLANDLMEVERLKATIEALSLPWRLAPRTVITLQIALEEVVSNVIRHGFRGRTEHQLIVRIHRRDDGVIAIEVEDNGAPFNPLTTPRPSASAPLDARQPGGLGVLLVLHMMDEVRYERVGERNVLSMTKTSATT
jgi:anti-sigma regulatory factor (Ser/Thr protein kinase)